MHKSKETQINKICVQALNNSQVRSFTKAPNNEFNIRMCAHWKFGICDIISACIKIDFLVFCIAPAMIQDFCIVVALDDALIAAAEEQGFDFFQRHVFLQIAHPACPTWECKGTPLNLN